MLFSQIVPWLAPKCHLPRGAFPLWKLVLPPSFTSTQSHPLLYFLNSIYHSMKRYCLCSPLECKSSARLGSRIPLARAVLLARRLHLALWLRAELGTRYAGASCGAAALSAPWRPKRITAPTRHKHQDTALEPGPIYSGGKEQPNRGGMVRWADPRGCGGWGGEFLARWACSRHKGRGPPCTSWWAVPLLWRDTWGLHAGDYPVGLHVREIAPQVLLFLESLEQ